jgi:hypothetical protein
VGGRLWVYLCVCIQIHVYKDRETLPDTEVVRAMCLFTVCLPQRMRGYICMHVYAHHSRQADPAGVILSRTPPWKLCTT